MDIKTDRNIKVINQEKTLSPSRHKLGKVDTLQVAPQEAECVYTQFYSPKSQQDPSGNFYYQQ